MEEALRALLTGSAAITALVPATSINWRRHPQRAAWPGIVLHVVNDGEVYLLSERTDRNNARVQVDCWALDYAAAKAISRAVTDLLSNYRDATFSRVHLIGARDAGEFADVPDDPAGVSLDFAVDYRRT